MYPVCVYMRLHYAAWMTNVIPAAVHFYRIEIEHTEVALINVSRDKKHHVNCQMTHVVTFHIRRSHKVQYKNRLNWSYFFIMQHAGYLTCRNLLQQKEKESFAVARKPRDAARATDITIYEHKYFNGNFRNNLAMFHCNVSLQDARDYKQRSLTFEVTQPIGLYDHDTSTLQKDG